MQNHLVVLHPSGSDSREVHLRGLGHLAAAGVERRACLGEEPRPHRGQSRRAGPEGAEDDLGALGALRRPARHSPRCAEGALASLPSGTRDGLNDWKRTGYGGPCPPIGRHRYFFKLYALDTVLPDLGKPSKAELLKAMEGHVVGTAELVGTYQKGQK